MIPSWIGVELASDYRIITGSTITIASTNDVLVHHGMLPQVVTHFEKINNGGPAKFNQLTIGSSSVGVQKLNGKKVFRYAAPVETVDTVAPPVETVETVEAYCNKQFSKLKNRLNNYIKYAISIITGKGK